MLLFRGPSQDPAPRAGPHPKRPAHGAYAGSDRHLRSISTSWTDYDSDTSFRTWSRAIDTRTGDYRESPNATEYGLGPILGNLPGANVPGFPEAGRFYEMGFDGRPGGIRWFMVFDTEEVTLWDFTDASPVPQNPAGFLSNVWHAPSTCLPSANPRV